MAVLEPSKPFARHLRNPENPEAPISFINFGRFHQPIFFQLRFPLLGYLLPSNQNVLVQSTPCPLFSQLHWCQRMVSGPQVLKDSSP